MEFLYNLFKGSTNTTKEASNDLKLGSPVTFLKASPVPTPVVTVAKGSNMPLYFSLVVFVAIAVVIIYYCVKVVLSYLGSTAFSVAISYPSDRALRVGEVISTKVTFSKLEENGQETICTAGQIQAISSNIIIHVNKEDLSREVSFLKAVGEHGDHCLRFSVRASGVYKLGVKCGYFHFCGSPLLFEVLPGPMSPLKTFLNTPNHKIIRVTVGQPHNVELIPQDKYGNLCPHEYVDCKKFSLEIKLGDMPIDEGEFERGVFCKGDKMILQLKATRCNIYTGHLTFAGHPVQHGSFMLVAMSVDENVTFDSGMNSFFAKTPGPCKGILVSVGSERTQPPLEVWINVNYRQIAVSNLILGFIYYPFKAFCVNRRTRVIYNGMYLVDANENDNLITLQISDGIQDCVTIAFTSSDARMLLASYGYFQGQKLSNYSFEDKKNTLRSELGGILSMLKRSPQIIHIDGSDLLASSIKNAPSAGSDWMKPFKVSFANARADTASKDASIETAKWLEMLVEMLFDHNETGLFSKYRSSRFLHPTLGSKRKPRWDHEYFEFAGSVLGKCVYDSLVNRQCLKLTRIRFTRSFLAQLIGVPITYKHFLTDDPAFYYQHVKPVMDNEEDVIANLKFTDIRDEGSRSPIGVNLIPNGNHIPVTKRNKEKYLNMIAIQRLKTSYATEMNAFRTGFYKIIPQGLIADFDEDELEKIFCGGGRRFNLSDLKNNSRIVGDLMDNQGISLTNITTHVSKFPQSQKQKVLQWFWTSVANMSDEEHEELLRMTTGSLVLPSCGFKDLNPKFTISLTGNQGQPPTGHPSLHQISLGNHSSYEQFDKNLLTAINGPPSPLDLENDREDLMQDNSTSAQVSLRLFNNIEAETETDLGNESDDDYPCVPWIKEMYRRHCAIM